MSRVTPIAWEAMSDEQKQLLEKIGRDDDVKNNGRMGGPHDIWILNPELGRRAMGMGDFFRFRSTVDRRYIELAIIIAGAFWKAKFEWFAHAPMAREAGVPDAVIDAVKRGEEPDCADDGDAVVWTLCTELHQEHHVTDETFRQAAKRFGEVGVAELVSVSGYYTMVSMTLNAFDVPLPEGAQDPWA